MDKTANQLYKESGTTLSFADWINQEKNNALQFIKNQKLNEIIQTDQNIISPTTPSIINNTKVFGLSKNIIILSSLILASAIGYKIYQKFKK